MRRFLGSISVRHRPATVVAILIFARAWTAGAADVPVPAPEPISVVVPDEPASGQRAAAERLTTLLERAGLAAKVVAAAEAPAGGPRICVGHGPHVPAAVAAPAEPEGLVVREHGGTVYLLGEIAPPGTVNNKTPLDRGVMHAVETFAERVLGYRFLFSTLDRKEPPGTFELGTVIPRLERLEVPAGLAIAEAPAFMHRIPNARPRNPIGLRAGSATGFYANHSYDMGWWGSKFGKSDPAMFIPKAAKDAEQADGAVAAMQSQPNLAWLDYTNPKVLEVRMEEVAKEVAGQRGAGFHYRPNQRYVIEETPDSAAPSVQYNERSRELFDPRHHPWGNFSNIWFDYLARMSPEVEKRFPGMRIATLAYMRHYGLPTFDLPGNIDVMLCLMRTSMGNKEPEVFARNLADVQAWSAKLGGDRSRLYLWEYGCWPAFWVSTPVFCPHAMQRWLTEVRPHVGGVFFEMYDPNEYYFLMRRLWMRLLWDPTLDVDAEIDDVCGKFFGPAGDSMAAFYKRLAAGYEKPWHDPDLVWDQYYLDNALYFEQSFPPEEIDRLAGLMETARRQAGLAPGFAGKLTSGAAVHIHNPGAEPEPLAFSVTALDDSLAGPTIVWEGGHCQFRDRLLPDERLDVAADGSAAVMTAAGERRAVTLVRAGADPVLAPGASQLVRFRTFGGNPQAGFTAAIHQGAAPADAAAAEPNIFARRLAWMSRPHRVLAPEASWGPDINPARQGKKSTNVGFLAHARWHQQAAGLVPRPDAPAVEEFVPPGVARAQELAAQAQAALKRAAKLTGPEQAAERAAAATAFREALALHPEWGIEGLDEKNPWAVVNARVARAGLWSGIGEFAKARAEYEAALKKTGKQKDAKSYVEMLIGDACRAEGDLAQAEEWYLKAEKTGLYGDRKAQVPQRLEQVRKARAAAVTP